MGKTKILWVDVKSTTWERYSVEIDEFNIVEIMGPNIWDYDLNYEEQLDSEPMTVRENNGHSTIEIRENKNGPVIWENGKLS